MWRTCRGVADASCLLSGSAMGFASFHYEPHMNPMMSRKKRRIDLGSCVLSPACMHSTHLARQGRGLEHTLAHTYIGTPAARAARVCGEVYLTLPYLTSCDQRIVVERADPPLPATSALSPQQSSTYPTTYLQAHLLTPLEPRR